MNAEKPDVQNEKVKDIEDQRQDDVNDKYEELLLPETDGLWYMGQSKKHRYATKFQVRLLLQIYILRFLYFASHDTLN